MSPRVVVVGGGLAGIAAALGLADGGADVTLLEAKPVLGGLTHSFTRGELSVDNGQHVFLRCCTAYLALLDRLGVAGDVVLQPRLDIAVRAPGGERARLRRSRLPAPLHLAGPLLRYAVLSPADRLRAVRAALALRGVESAEPRSDDGAFGAWLDRHGQSSETVARLWDLFTVATLNAPAADASLGLAAMVFQTGLLTDASAGDIGWSRVPLQELHGDAAVTALERAGASVRSRAKVERVLATDGGGWRVAERDGVVHEADAVVLAVPPPQAELLLPAGSVGLPGGWSDQLGSAPILNAHVVFDRHVLDEPFVATVDSPLQWVFDRTEQSGLRSGQYVAVSISAAQDWVDAPAGQVRERVLPALAAVLPAVSDADILDFFVTRERAATFRPSPGVARLRPGTLTSHPGLVVAGAWTATGWPATMEGAVRSGNAAALAVLSLTGRAHRDGGVAA